MGLLRDLLLHPADLAARCEFRSYASRVTSEVTTAAIVAILITQAIATFFKLFYDRAKLRVEASSRWDAHRFDSFAQFSSSVGDVLRSGDAPTAGAKVQVVQLAYERVLLVGNPEVARAADRARRTAWSFLQSLPEASNDPGVEMSTIGHGYTANGKRVSLSLQSSQLQAAGYEALTAFTNAARKSLHIGDLQSESLRPPAGQSDLVKG